MRLMQVSIIIGVILVVIGGESIASEEYSQSVYLWIFRDEPWKLAGITGSLILLFGLSVYSVNRVITSSIKKGRYFKRVSKIITIWRVSAVFLAGIFSFLLGWGNLAESITDVYFFKMILWLLPFMILIFIQLFYCYELDVYSRRGCLPAQCMGDDRVWSRSSYMKYNLRHNLLGIVVPIFLISILAGMGESFYDYLSANISNDFDIPIVEAAVSFVTIGFAYFLAPLILRYVWMTTPMPGGQQRENLEAFCSKIKLKYSNILLWKTYRMVGNAAVTGLLPFIRYVIVSDKLLENLTDEQLCAVFGHEAGHIHHKHMPLLLMAIIGIITMLGLAVDIVIGYIPEDWPWWGQELLGYSIGIVMLGVGFCIFGFISRNFEREADVYGASSSDNFNQGIDGRLSSIGSAIMSSALQRLAFINGVSVNARSWRHSSLSSRMELLFELAVIPGMLKKFRRRLVLVKTGVVLLFLLSVILVLG